MTDAKIDNTKTTVQETLFSPRRIAQLGLGAACLTLVTCITVLVAGARDNSGTQGSGGTPVISEQHSTQQISGMQLGISPRIAYVK